MNKFRLYLKENPKIPKLFVLGYIVFAGCFTFPFRNEMFPFDFSKAYLVLLAYGIIGFGLGITYGKDKYKFVYISSFALTVLGIICNYFLEYGEVSNTRDFVLLNIVSYLLVVPILTTVAYHITTIRLAKENNIEKPPK